MKVRSTYCDAAQWEYQSDVQYETYRQRVTVVRANHASGRPENRKRGRLES